MDNDTASPDTPKLIIKLDTIIKNIPKKIAIRFYLMLI